MEIRVVESINDALLKYEWERLEQEADLFIQNTYHWCSTWWKYLGGKRKLHVVMALDRNGKAACIAPLCVEKKLGVSVLRSFPIHFGDFYTFIRSDGESSQMGIDRIMAYLESNDKWQWVRIDQVSEENELSEYLIKKKYRRKRMTGCVIVDLGGLDWEKYLSRLKKSFRKKTRRRLKEIQEKFDAELKIIDTWERYEEKFDEMLEIFNGRWADDYIPAKGLAELECWRTAIRGQFEKGRIVYCQLLLNKVPVAYRLGFMHKNTYYAWHTSYDRNYKSYNVGIMMMAFMIQYFLKNSISKINFMAGDYDWKLDWSPNRKIESNYMFTSPASNIGGLILTLYHYSFRDKLKKMHSRLLKSKIFRIVYRKILLVLQKSSGSR